MTITVSLSSAGLAHAAKQLRDYAQSLDAKTERLVEDLGKAGAEYADWYLEHDDTGYTRSTIGYTRQGKSCTVSVGGAAVWIEFGTGVLANAGNSPHPKKDEVGAFGWGEYGHGYGKDIWYFPSKRYGKWLPTAGIPMNPFMYETSQSLRFDLIDFARRAFND